ncbi:MAG: signal peptide protein [Planctomycetaceae bacterium]|nr:signal peptide protein [Planctomycetaceae bacterium]
MRILIVTILMLNASAYRALAAEPAGKPLTLDEVRKAGRAKSLFLKEAEKKIEPTPAIPAANLDHFQKSIAPVLAQKCVACHGPNSTMANLRIDRLNPDLLAGPDVDRWRGIYKVLSNSEMPPEDAVEYRLADADRQNVVEWLSEEMSKASIARRNRSEHSSFRRMTKYEYNYALQDLLGLPYPIANSLPPETASEDGFKNSSDLLQMSTMQFEAYRELGLKAFQRVTVSGERPTPVTYIISMQEVMTNLKVDKNQRFNVTGETDSNHRNRSHLFNRTTGEGILFSEGNAVPKPGEVAGHTPDVSPVVVVLPRSNELKLNLDRFLPDEGMLRVRIRAGRTTNQPNEYASLRLIFSAHTSNNANFSQVVSQRDLPVTASADKPEFIEFDIPLSEIQRNPFRKLETTFPRRDEFLHIRNESNAPGGKDPLRVVIDYIEVSAPHFDQWPPQSHLNIFFKSENKSNEQVYGQEVLTRFLERAWRRPVAADEVGPYMDLFAKYRPDFDTFEGAMLEVLATALAAPEFLYLTQRSSAENAGNDKTGKPETISDLELASRLSFFLWSSLPDQELLELARKGTLKNPAVLNSQVDRMLADPRAERFGQHFAEQWLGLDGMGSVTHINKDDPLGEAMRQEPIAFFREVLYSNSSVMDFLHSDYAVVNERLAQHYGIPGVFGPHFRKVPIMTETHRGGILTAAGMLSMNSDGTDSHPLKRGVWLLERILQDPPPPPPANVPKVDLTDPRILQMTLKERIADHRSKAACISCHSRIDPWGIAFENYDALGAWRTNIKNKPVDATSVLFNKQELAGVDGLKRYLLADRQDQFAKAMVHKMSAYALGRPLTFADHRDVESLTVQFRKQGDLLADLIHLVVNSKLFRSK